VNSKPPDIFVFDAGPLIEFQRAYPPDLFLGLWKFLEEFMNSSEFCSHEVVFDELTQSDRKDEITRLVKENKNKFIDITPRQAEIVGEILQKTPRLIDADNPKNQADAWVIAVAKELAESAGLIAVRPVVVSTESETSSNRIPAACKSVGVKHMSLLNFLRNRGLMFGLKRSENVGR
jgi:hypothetical protein